VGVEPSIRIRYTGECQSWKGSRRSANPEKAQGGVQNPEKAQGGVQILKRLKEECKSWKGSRRSADPEKAQGGVQILKRLKGECRSGKGSRRSANTFVQSNLSIEKSKPSVKTIKVKPIRRRGIRGPYAGRLDYTGSHTQDEFVPHGQKFKRV
jgi:hypothetical protein